MSNEKNIHLSTEDLESLLKSHYQAGHNNGYQEGYKEAMKELAEK